MANLSPSRSHAGIALRRVAELDFDFAAERSESPFSDLHWHPCRYPSQIPAVVIARLTESGDTVLDPFLGSGTTLAEAQKLGRRSIGVDINPISTIIVAAKVIPDSARNITFGLNQFRTKLHVAWSDSLKSRVPPTVQGDKWFTKNSLAALGKLWSTIEVDNTNISPILKAAFSSILLPACRETRHWGYVCDNSAPKSDYERDVLKLFLVRLKAWERAYIERDSYLDRTSTTLHSADVLTGDAATTLAALPDSSVKLVLTSPPYQGVADYVKAQRLSMEWFGLEIEPFRLSEIGARSKRHRRAASEDYLSDLTAVFRQCHRVLSPDGWAVAVIGESAQRAAVVDDFLTQMSEVGFVVETVTYRQISQSRRQMPSLNREAIVFMRKQQ